MLQKYLWAYFFNLMTDSCTAWYCLSQGTAYGMLIYVLMTIHWKQEWISFAEMKVIMLARMLLI